MPGHRLTDMNISKFPLRFRSIVVTVAVAAAVGTLGLTIPAQSKPTQPTQERTVTAATPIRTIVVHGVGFASGTPDQASITLGVETVGATAQSALRDNTAKASELIKLLKAAGVEDKFIQTSQLSIYPRYDNEGKKINGYQVSNIVTATLKDMKKAGEVIDQAAGIAGDAIRIQGVSFSLSQDSPLIATMQKNARTRAVADAKLQAEQLAEVAGVKLGQLRTISTSSNMSAPVLYQQNFAKTSADASGTVPLEGGSQQITAEVDLVFDIA